MNLVICSSSHLIRVFRRTTLSSLDTTLRAPLEHTTLSGCLVSRYSSTSNHRTVHLLFIAPRVLR